MSGHTDLMNDLRHIRLQIPLDVLSLAFVGINPANLLEILLAAIFSHMFDTADHHIIVKRFQNIVICTQGKGILRDLLLPHSSDHDKGRAFLHIFVFVHPLHHR